MATVTGIFTDAESALQAAEDVREVAGPRATVRVLLPGQGRSLVEVAVVADTGGSLRVAAFGVALGFAAGLFVLALGLGWTLALVALATGVASGLLLGLWLTGERFPSRLLAGPDAAAQRRALLHDGESVVTAVVGARYVDAVRRAIADGGGQVGDGFLPEREALTGGDPLPT